MFVIESTFNVNRFLDCRVPGAAAEEASLYPALREMQQLRPAAFARSYLVVDECSWGLPVAVRLLLARRHAVERGRKLDAADLVQEISSLNKRRVQAVVNDRAPLVKYGLRLTEYCLRLEAIVSALKMVVPSYLSPSGGTVPLFDARELRADDPDARPEYTGRRLQEVRFRLVFAFNEQLLFTKARAAGASGPPLGPRGARDGQLAGRGADPEGPLRHRRRHGRRLPPAPRDVGTAPVAEHAGGGLQSTRIRLVAGKQNLFKIDQRGMPPQMEGQPAGSARGAVGIMQDTKILVSRLGTNDHEGPINQLTTPEVKKHPAHVVAREPGPVH